MKVMEELQIVRLVLLDLLAFEQSVNRVLLGDVLALDLRREVMKLDTRLSGSQIVLHGEDFEIGG